MNDKHTKIGFSEIGGLFIGKDIHSGFLCHYAVSVIISLGEPFTITNEQNQEESHKVVLIQKNTRFKLDTPGNTLTVFLHILPFSEAGMRLTSADHPIQTITYEKIEKVLHDIDRWYKSDTNTPQFVSEIIESISIIAGSPNIEKPIDNRIFRALNLIMHNDEEKIPVDKIAGEVNLSVSHFNRLFRKETGLSFRKFVLHSKLIRSISSMSVDGNLTAAAFIGGFSDQPHLTRTFKENFGIQPSKTVK